MKNGKSLQYYIRVLHRNLGFLALCMTVVYALSGIVLTHRAGNFMKKSTLVEKTISQGLDQKGLEKELKMRKFKAGEAQEGFIAFNEDGKYEISTGKVTYSQSDYVWPMDKLVALHKTSSEGNPHAGWFVTLYGVVLFFLAVSSLFMFQPKAKAFKTGLVYAAVGLVLTVLLLVI